MKSNTIHPHSPVNPCLVLALLLGGVQPAVAATAVRSFDCEDYVPLQPTMVTVVVSPDTGTQNWAAEESIPSSWTVSNINEGGGYDSVNHKVKWGPFFSNQVRSLSYHATPPAGETGTRTFSGIASFDGQNVVTGGVSSISLDTTAPTITCPGNPAPIPANANCQAAVPNLVAGATATDNCDSSVTITQNPAAGALVGLGNTTVTLTATDDAGNTNTCTVTVTVVDGTKPTITCPATPAPIPANANCQAAVPNLVAGATATDNCDSSVTITQNPTAGTLVGLGNTTVTLTATDDAGNTNTCTVTVTVVDGTKPTITCPAAPAPIPANATCQAAVPNLVAGATATDNCDSSVTITQNPASGTLVGLGNSTVTLTATDDAGNTQTCTVTVNVFNSVPVIQGGAASVSMKVVAGSTCPGVGNQISLNATDAGQDTSQLSWSIKTNGVTGTASIVGSTTGASVTVCYAPQPNQTQADSFVVAVTDPCGAADEITVNVTVTSLHPADSGGDWSLDISEVTAYGACWRSGCTWPAPPNPIPIDYVTRAGFLWRTGESYHYDGAQACPLCWQSSPAPAPAGSNSADGDQPGLKSLGVVRPIPPVVDTRRSIGADAQHRGRWSVSIAVVLPGEAGTWAVEETVPNGCGVSDTSEGGAYNADDSTVRWGPFLDDQERTLTYTVELPEGVSSGTVNGVVSVDGHSAAIAGDDLLLLANGKVEDRTWPCGTGAAPAAMVMCLILVAVSLKKHHRRQ